MDLVLSSYEDILLHYLRTGTKYRLVLQYLKLYHGISISLRSLERDAARLGFRRNGISRLVSPHQLTDAIASVQSRSGFRAGYRRTWYHINNDRGIRVTQRQVLLELRRQNAANSAMRVSRVLTRRHYMAFGPNHVWHCDGYDKLKPYGFAIHGCIDGYSRKVLWAECAVTNNDPSVILHFYLSNVRTLNGTPHLLRTDRGTENVLMAAAHCTLRNEERSHLFGTSQHNQRIEAWWCILRKGWTDVWLGLFDNLMTFRSLDLSHPEVRPLLWFCFSEVIQDELNWFVNYWNHHLIRVKRRSGRVGGVPNDLYFLHNPRFHNRLHTVEQTVVDILFDRSTASAAAELQRYPEQRERYNLLIQQHMLTIGSSRDERTSLFLALCAALQL